MVTRRDVLEGSLLLAANACLPGTAVAASESDRPSRDRLWYRRPATEWTQALPVGNGRIGAMVFGGVGTERLQLNEDTVWSGGPYDPVNPAARDALPEVRRLIAQGDYAQAHDLANRSLIGQPVQQMAYQSFGDLLLRLPGAASAAVPADYARVLDLDSATATTTFTLAGTRHHRTVFASPVRQVIVLRHEVDGPASLDLDIGFAPAQEAQVEARDGLLLIRGRNRGAHGVDGALKLAGLVRVIPEGGSLTAQGDHLALRGARAVTVLVAMATSFRRFDDVSGDPDALVRDWIVDAMARSSEQLHGEAVAAHRALYRRVEIDLGDDSAVALPTDQRVIAAQSRDDPGLAALYFNYGRYLLIASSRPGSQAANLQGIWNGSIDPPWGSKYTININTQMNYWPAEITALPECTEPLVRMVRELAESGARTAREMYGARGWVAHHNSDIWRATAPVDGARWGMWPTGGAWLCTHLWERWDYGRDKTFLRDVYPLMRGAALFFVDTLQVDPETGALVTSPSLSPENAHHGDIAICAGPAMDQQILRDLFDQTAQAADLLGIDSAFAAELRALRSRLALDRIGAQGQLQEWQQDWDAQAPEPDHRHVSHLYGLFPSQQIDLDDTPALAAAARRSLELRGDLGTGWATAWRINLWARLGDGDRAHRILRFLLGPERTYPNLFDAHPPFQIDGNFGGTAGIAHMLMRSRGDEIHLLPALPSAWPTGAVRGLRARGACSVDFSWAQSRPRTLTLTSAIDAERTVRFGSQRVIVRLTASRPQQVDVSGWLGLPPISAG
ncbi:MULTISPECIES: glycosyl hydrolase family 95 catalytic domain-containing protein [Sphingobium]|uniref:glycoside hydrolase family 95 protein n=1 Tax=Sphingobium TaxID=165695 RepID=UPI0015EB3ECA|nr:MULTISPECIES: glycoside hydrolase family 95 protein [Sphingobium]MCW2362307.1 alpha-L-fucosidase 2 [Sphingobium sp. B10D3B]MCW2401014.1 alpha-L-fucosidase 2 [Sphingobium sp. B10D7B]MCW2407993.1 alpha-L-fucosidase 2 [Sphingobium xanthum]